MTDTISVWSVITVVLLPIMILIVGAQAHQLSKHRDEDIAQHDDMWRVINGLRQDLTQHKVDCERDFARRTEMRDRFGEISGHMESRLQRIEHKIDRLIGSAASPRSVLQDS